MLAAARQFGGLNCLINAAGINQFSLLERQEEEAIAQLIEINVTATLQLTHRLLPLLRQPQALVVNLGSIFGSIGYAGFSHLLRQQVRLARVFRSAAPRTGGQPRSRCCTWRPRATRTAMNSAGGGHE